MVGNELAIVNNAGEGANGCFVISGGTLQENSITKQDPVDIVTFGFCVSFSHGYRKFIAFVVF